MNRYSLGSHCLVSENRENLCRLLLNHPVCELNTLLADLEHESLKLWMNCIQNTCTPMMNSTSCAFCAVGHKLFRDIHIINLCEQPLQAMVAKRNKASIGTCWVMRLTGCDKLVNCLNEVAFLLMS